MPPIYPRPVTLCLALLFLTSSLSRALDISIPLHAASTTPKITPSHVSLSIEMDRWTDWAGSVSRNQFFFNTLDNLKQITGTPPSVRVGGNTMDATTFRADIGVCNSCSTIWYSIFMFHSMDSLRKMCSPLQLRRLRIQKQRTLPSGTYSMEQPNFCLLVSRPVVIGIDRA